MSHPEDGYTKEGETLWDFVQGLIENNADRYKRVWDLLKVKDPSILLQFFAAKSRPKEVLD